MAVGSGSGGLVGGGLVGGGLVGGGLVGGGFVGGGSVGGGLVGGGLVGGGLVGGGIGVFVLGTGVLVGGTRVFVGLGIAVRVAVGGRPRVLSGSSSRAARVNVGGMRVRVGEYVGVVDGSSVGILVSATVLVCEGAGVAVGANWEMDSTVNAAIVLILEIAESTTS